MPPYVAVLLVVTGISFVLGLTRLPGSLSQAIRFDRGSARVEKGDVSGVDDMAEVYRHLDDPNSQARLDMANAYLKAGRKEESAKIIESMVGMKLDSKELERAKEIGAQAGANVN